jgi:O-acetyl-ADP-ribose deacetylase (regulator of RNase III)
MNFSYLSGNLITLARAGQFDVIVHGVNCFNNQSAGLAKQMADAFSTKDTDMFPLEHGFHHRDINKLGQINYYEFVPRFKQEDLVVVNAYTMFSDDLSTQPFDYEAFTLCMRKINHLFKGLHIGMPEIGTHLAGGDWHFIEPIIIKELKDCNVTIVKYGSETH